MLSCMDQHVERVNIHLGLVQKQLHKQVGGGEPFQRNKNRYGFFRTEYKAHSIFTMDGIFTATSHIFSITGQKRPARQPNQLNQYGVQSYGTFNKPTKSFCYCCCCFCCNCCCCFSSPNDIVDEVFFGIQFKCAPTQTMRK